MVKQCVVVLGLVLPGESPEQSAEREVRECAGFEGVARKAGPELAADPTASGCAMRMVTVEVSPRKISGGYFCGMLRRASLAARRPPVNCCVCRWPGRWWTPRP